VNVNFRALVENIDFVGETPLEVVSEVIRKFPCNRFKGGIDVWHARFHPSDDGWILKSIGNFPCKKFSKRNIYELKQMDGK
jgi:hypothetical protein